MMETVTCAICGNPVSLDSDYVDVVAETKWTGDRNDRDDFAFHIDCWERLSSGWAAPA